MPFDFNEFLVLAQELGARTDEASKRSAISRAYYTAYHLAVRRAEANVGPFNGHSKHNWCWEQYTKTKDPDTQQIGIDGGRMKRRRHIADYNAANSPNLDIEVQRQIEDALQLQADIAALDPRYPHP